MTNLIADSLSAHAESIAKTMHELAQWSKTHPNSRKYNRGLIKLPPVFLQNSDKHGDGFTNLVAMIKTIGVYEDGDENGNYPTLSELPSLYNKFGGLPYLEDKDFRKLHNWVRQVGFGIRAAIMEQEDKKPLFNDWVNFTVPERVYQRLYRHNERRSFITCSQHNPNEYKPLRYADEQVKMKWIEQEYQQRKSRKKNEKYGAKLTEQEWREYGLSGQQGKQIRKQLENGIQHLLELAEKYDNSGRYEQADAITHRINKMNADLVALDVKG